ncbi:MAG: hypothetical protein IJP33_05010 [Firmicutes bacterium]|nr:hypothetical protein [Bacillota bacterium]
MWEELEISSGTAIIVLIALYFIIKWGVKNGIRDYFKEEEQKESMLKRYEEYHNEQENEKNE